MGTVVSSIRHRHIYYFKEIFVLSDRLAILACRFRFNVGGYRESGSIAEQAAVSGRPLKLNGSLLSFLYRH